ncbi:MAG TPA: homoserine dehydrogenase [Bryocella sp.]|nr:homoserine dehydrogenase [Bryocella sp.]
MPGKVIVLKFGSSVLQSRAELPDVVHEIYRWIRRQYRVVAVVSAFAGETDRLLESVAGYRDAQAEAVARIVATGEEVATAFLALELDRFGIPAQVLDPSQIRLIVDSASNDTEPVFAETAAIEGVLDQGRVAVIPGFVARDRSGRVALFGRGGSDLSALFLAKQLNARCRLIKDVDGIYNADPATCPDAQRYAEIEFADALAIGGKVVQPKAISFGRKTGVAFEVAALGENDTTLVGARRSVLSPAATLQAPLKIGLLGLGTVGLGVFRELWKHPDRFEVTGIAVRRPEAHFEDAPSHLLTRDCWDVIEDVDVVVELIGGGEPAGDLVRAALAAGKPVVTANKLLVASDGALGNDRGLRYSAAVGGAVPALEAVQALADDGRVLSLSGVLNGTCNYILDRIAAGCSWQQALGEAQEHGFAEQDPTADVSGADTVCKLRLLARRAFAEVEAHSVKAIGIDCIDPEWVQSAARKGSRARLVGTARFADGRVHLEVKPTLVHASHPFAQIRNEENCLLIHTAESDAPYVWTGRGAGRWPTTAAVMADLFDLSREHTATSCELRASGEDLHAIAGLTYPELLQSPAAPSIELRDPRQPSVSPFLHRINSSRPSGIAREITPLTAGNRQLTTDFGGVA